MRKKRRYQAGELVFVGVRLPGELLRRIDRAVRVDVRWMFANRSRAIRALLDEALMAREGRKREDPKRKAVSE